MKNIFVGLVLVINLNLHASTLTNPPSESEIIQVLSSHENEYMDQEGYALFAERFFMGKMEICFEEVKAALPIRYFKKMGWRKINGTLKDYELLKEFLLVEGGTDVAVEKFFQEMTSFNQAAFKFAINHKNRHGDFTTHFLTVKKNMMAILSDIDLLILGWDSSAEKKLERLHLKKFVNNTFLTRRVEEAARVRAIDVEASISKGRKR